MGTIQPLLIAQESVTYGVLYLPHRFQMDSWNPPNIAYFGNYGMQSRESTWTPPGLHMDL